MSTFSIIMYAATALIAIFMVRWKRSNSAYRTLLSRPARDILHLYRSLPVDSRVTGEWELKQTLYALDVTNGGRSKVKAHFMDSSWAESHYSFSRQHYGCNGYRCKMGGYLEIKEELTHIKTAIAEREQKIKEITVAKMMPDVTGITERLRQERYLIQTVTKEISE